MQKKLVIVESPAKARTINKILGKDYDVRSSKGHIRDLPQREMGVDIKNGFEPRYVMVQGRRNVVTELKKAAEQCHDIYLAPDPDREGEAIAWHLRTVLEDSKVPHAFFRVQYNEITPRAIRDAFVHPVEVDMRRVEAQQARRVLDRIVGYMVSPMLWRKVERGLSAGRVQSVALRLLCEREDEISRFVPEPFWVMGARVRKQVAPTDPFDIRLVSVDGNKADIKEAAQADAVLAGLQHRRLRVQKTAVREVVRRAMPPYITSTLQQAASSHCGMSPRRTMSVAQKLYEGVDVGEGPVGLITYMRTDSVVIAEDAIQECRAFVASRYGSEYLPESPNRYRSRESAQQAHEAIRPTDVQRTPESLATRLDSAELKLYRLIWNRFVASQMAPAVFALRTVDVETVPEDGQTLRAFGFRATASDVKFPGYLKVLDEPTDNGREEEEFTALPELREGESLECLEWLSVRKETRPPSRYSEAALVRALEHNGVGRPSTYAQILSTLHQRRYVDRENRALMPTELGRRVCGILTSELNQLFNVGFTAEMENSLDQVEQGTLEWRAMLDAFYAQFRDWMAQVKTPTADPAVVREALDLLQTVQAWNPPVKRGKRTYSDEKFVQSITQQLADGKRSITPRQLDALVRMLCLYRTQLPGAEPFAQRHGFAEVFAAPELQPPRDSTRRKLELLARITLDERAESFIGSLRSQVMGGRRLSEAQIRALDNVVLKHGPTVPDFAQLRDSLGLAEQAPIEDRDSGELLQAMAGVQTWKEPVKRGKRVFDDHAFRDSLQEHFTRKGFLTPRQQSALKRLLSRYRDQVPDYANVAAKHGIGKKNRPEPAEDA